MDRDPSSQGGRTQLTNQTSKIIRIEPSLSIASKQFMNIIDISVIVFVQRQKKGLLEIIDEVTDILRAQRLKPVITARVRASGIKANPCFPNRFRMVMKILSS